MKFMKSTILSIAICFAVNAAHAQVNDPNQVAKDAATNHANNDMSNAADNGLNKAEQGVGNLFKKKNKDKKTDASQNNSNQTTNSSAQTDPSTPTSIKAYQNYDFVPGDKVVFEDHFTDDRDGEFPTHWELKKGQATLNKFNGAECFFLTDGNYCQVSPLITNKSYLGNQFTIEYDTYNPNNGAYGLITFLQKGEDDAADIQITTGEVTYDGHEGTKSFSGSLPPDIQYDNYKDRWHHVAIAYNNKQLKVYVDQYRILYVPGAEEGITSVGFGGIGDQTNPIIFKNVRIATGGSMNLVGHKFTDAKIVTHGINFDVDKSTIRPESMGTLNMVVQVMKDNPDIKFEIDGHTDNSGSAPHNLTLSQQRADAVKAQLVSMGIDAGRLSSKGFGDTKPIADNNTLEGKANNRRVEFVKM